ncbi:uncharacterized protein LOC113234925 [Hyposmocoma kahamanoa]|uniref:uncharacterized protein LOC113234925 n=1 Tax=Hyposmocoma kahamanoa TaxID=1477025 RepID=UPI000E6D6E69|nr:uncharacterized protein LOC113234925 [Hyposmocoma kahamanoa]
MGVFKWLRRERLTVTEEVITTPTTTSAPKIIVKAQGSQSAAHIGTIRTEEYKRDLAEFQARRSHGNKDPPETPVKKKCGRHSLPVSCTACSTDMDNTFNYEKKSATKYKKRSHRRTRSAAVDTEGLPSIQFLFQNQVFMPGNLLPTSNYTEPRKTRRTSPFVTDFFKQSDVTEENTKSLLYKNNSLPIDMKTFREGINIKEEIDGVTLMEKASSQGSCDAKMDSSVWEVMNELKSFDLWADEQLQTQSGSKSDDSKSDTSAYGLPVASAINMDITKSSDHHKWDHGSWGQVPVQVKKLVGVTVGHVKQKVNTEINILSCRIPAVKPASHCVDTLLKSFPHLNAKKAASKPFRGHPVSPASSGKSGSHWEQFCQARESVAKCINFGNRDIDRFRTWKKDADKGTLTEEDTYVEQRTDQATDTRSIEDFIRDLIRKELQHMLHEISDDNSSSFAKNDEIINKGVANVVENLRNGEDANQTLKKDANLKSFSRVKINGNNKPLLQITFSRSGENSLQVLDNCVNVTICDNNNSGKDNLNISMEDTVSSDDVQAPSLKRCQAFNAIQEARSTEDLYIDDDLSTQMQENFGGRVKLIPLHGSLHEILCEKEDDCCLIKVKQENGCDTIYFRCDNSDTESRDAIDGCSFDNSRAQDTVLFKRSISLVEERIQRVFPKDKKNKTPLVCRRTKSNECNKAQSKSEVNQFVQTPIVCRRTKNTECENIRPKSEVFVQTINEGSRVLSNSSPSLVTTGDEIELNIENVMSYQDSSSEECVKNLQETDDFELLEKKIEADLAKADIAGVINTNAELAEVDLNKSSLNCGYLQKISEENLSVLNEDIDSEAEKENTEIV